MNNLDDKNFIIHYPKDETRVVAVALCLHGLNLIPSQMDELAELLCSQGVIVLRGSLQGHTRSKNSLSSHTQWYDDINFYYRKLKKINSENLPCLFLGQSLSCAIVKDMTNKRDVGFDAHIFFAPLFRLRFASWLLLSMITKLPFIGKITSMADKTTRVWREIPIRFYKEALTIFRNVSSSNSLKNSVVFISKGDELISYKGVKEIGYKIIDVNSLDSKLITKREHLNISKESVGDKQWSLIKDSIQEFIRLHI